MKLIQLLKLICLSASLSIVIAAPPANARELKLALGFPQGTAAYHGLALCHAPRVYSGELYLP